MFWGKFSCPYRVWNPTSPISQPSHYTDYTILAQNDIYIYTYIHLFNSEVALKWDSKHFKDIFEMSRSHISAQRSLLFMKAQVFFTPWG